MTRSHNTFILASLVGYAEYTLEHGDNAAAQLAVGFQQMVRELAYYQSCEVVSSVGDAVMVRAPDPAQAVRLAKQILEAGIRRGQLPIRFGVDTGPAVRAAGAWYGRTVNCAAQIAQTAEPGEVLMTGRACTAHTGGGRLRVLERGLQSLERRPQARTEGACATVVAA